MVYDDPHNQAGDFCPFSQRGMGDAKRFQSELAFLLILPERVAKGELAFGLVVVWVYPYQACIPSLEEAARKLTLITPSRENWVYAFVQFNDDAQYVPSLKKVT